MKIKLLSILLLSLILFSNTLIHAAMQPVGNLQVARSMHTATMLSNGLLLVVGGKNGNTVHSSAELYNPQTGESVMVGSMSTPRYAHAAILLKNGSVLISGGHNGTAKLDSAEIYHPELKKFVPTGNMNLPRLQHTASLLENGKVLIGGGMSGNESAPVGAELYDPNTGQFESFSVFDKSFRNHTANVLTDGNVLMTAGNGKTGVTSVSYLYNAQTNTIGLTNASLYYPVTEHASTMLPGGHLLVTGGHDNNVSRSEYYLYSGGSFITVGTMPQKRARHSSTLLTDGRLLLCGGIALNEVGALQSCHTYSRSANSFDLAEPLLTSRYYHTATLIPGGRVVFIGGENSGGAISQVEQFDNAIPAMYSSSVMLNGRSHHGMSMLMDGRVLHSGGEDGDGTMAKSEIYDPATDLYTVTNPMTVSRAGHSSTLLNNGKVLIAGGGRKAPLTRIIFMNSAELFDPSNGTYTDIANMNHYRSGHTATLLANGNVLLAGGSDANGSLAAAEIYNPVSNTFTVVGNMQLARQGHAAILLNDGTVMITGGYSTPGNYLASSEIFNPATNSFSSGPAMTAARAYHSMSSLAAGKLLVAGGYNSNSISTAEVYHPVSKIFYSVGSMNTPRRDHVAVTMRDGRVLIAGGYNAATASKLNSIELFNPLQEQFEVLPITMIMPRDDARGVLLQSGNILISGGSTNSGYQNHSEQFEAGLEIGNDRLRPEIADMSVSDSVNDQINLRANGTNFGGDSEAGSGQGNSSSAAVPVLQLQKIDNGAIFKVPYGYAMWDKNQFSIYQSDLSAIPSGHYAATISASGMTSKGFITSVMPVASLFPERNDFGSVVPGSSSASTVFTIMNLSGRTVEIGTVTLSGSHSGDFIKKMDQCSGIQLPPGQSSFCTFEIVFKPQSEGVKSAAITVTSNAKAVPAATISGTGVLTYVLTVNKTGSGGGAVLSDGGSISWNGNTGTASYTSGRGINLTVVSDANSQFSGWGGDCSGTGTTCTLVMNVNHSVTAGFETTDRVKIGSTAYGSIASAYENALKGNVIKVRALTLTEKLSFDRASLFTLKGGYNSGFSSQSGYSIVDGSITVKTGSAVMDRIVVK